MDEGGKSWFAWLQHLVWLIPVLPLVGLYLGEAIYLDVFETIQLDAADKRLVEGLALMPPHPPQSHVTALEIEWRGRWAVARIPF